MNRRSDISGVIMAGGLSTRIGRDKGELSVGGRSLASLSAEKVCSIFEEVVYVTNMPDSAPDLTGMKVAQDEIPHLGPLGGLLAGLKAISNQRAFVVAYDMPFISTALVHFLLDYDPRADVVCPEINGRPEPLHALYSTNCVRIIASQLEEGQRKIVAFYPRMRVTLIPEKHIREFDPELRSFVNINTWDDLAAAEGLARGK